ncbi:MAG: cohesin domain-containing protein [Acidobacteriota bacterium]
MRRIGRAFWLGIAGSLIIAVLTACGGGGGGGGGPTAPPPPPMGIVYTGATGGGAGFTLTQASVTATTLTLDLQANGVTDLYGVALDLQFPSQLFNFVSATEQPFLGQSGAVATTLQATEASPGVLVVGFSRLGQVAGVSGTGALVRIQFQAIASGSGGFAYADNQAFSPNDTLGGLSWQGGSVQVNL